MKYNYDEEGDILYCTIKEGKGCLYDLYGKGLSIRIDKDTFEPYGFLILNYSEYSSRFVEIRGLGVVVPPPVDCFKLFKDLEDCFNFKALR